MTENLGRLHVALENLFDVRAANAASSNFDQHFAVAHFRDGHFFDADDSLFAVNAGAHGFGNGAQHSQSFHDCARSAHVAETSSMSR